MTRTYDVYRTNGSATRLLGSMVLDPTVIGERPNLMHAFFDPRLARTFIVDWERNARQILSRLHRESLARPTDKALGSLVRALLEYPGVPESFRHPDFTAPSEPTFALRFRRETHELAFLVTVTAFSVPQNVTLDELRMESYFPLDKSTEEACRRLAG
jgi:hypothetical protein